MGIYDALFQPLQIKSVRIRNRVMSSAHLPGYAEQGLPGERYMAYHEEKAKGGIGLTVFGGSSTVARESPPIFNQISVADDSIVPHFRRFADRVHAHGAALFCQITHLGRRSRWDMGDWLAPISASSVREPLHRHYAKTMEDWDFLRVIADYAAAARRCLEGGLDGVEVHGAGPHLIAQFLSALTNHRADAYGGDLAHRMRFAIEVLTAIRAAVGPNFIVGIRLSGDDMVEGGLNAEDCLRVAKRLSSDGLIDYIILIGSTADRDATFARSLPGMDAPLAPFLPLAAAVKREVGIPVFHAQNLNNPLQAAQAIASGQIDMAALTRAHLADPHIMRKLTEGRAEQIRPCVGANYCLGGPGGTVCIHNVATGRETWLSHEIAPAKTRRRAVVIGGGPGGMEAARVLAVRGHDVTLFEACDQLGGQLRIARRPTWRKGLGRIADWLAQELQRRGVDMRLGQKADVQSVIALRPDVVVVATGGLPDVTGFEGADLAISTWKALENVPHPDSDVLVYDELGDHQAASCAEELATRGARVEIVTPDRAIGLEMTHPNWPIHYRELGRLGVTRTTDMRVASVARDKNRLRVTFQSEHDGQVIERVVDQVVVERGTVPSDDLYHALRPYSSNRGQIAPADIVNNHPFASVSFDASGFVLFRVGDAVAGRNVHAAMLDALRLCSHV